MKSIGCCIIGLFAVMVCQSQQSAGPTGKGQQPRLGLDAVTARASEAVILQSLHEQNLEDTSRLVTLSRELKWELADNDRQVLSVATVKKMDEIERVIRRIRARVGKK